MVRERRTELERQLSHFSKEYENLLQVHVSEYQPGSNPVMYLNSDHTRYEAGDSGTASLAGKDLGTLGVEVLSPEEVEEMRARNNGVPIESILSGPLDFSHLDKSTVRLNIYPENIANPEESVGKTPDFVYNSREVSDSEFT